MSPWSISNRVYVAFGALLFLSILLLATGLMVAQQVRDSNLDIARLSGLLQSEDRQERHQQELRLEIGEITRMAERGNAVPASEWRRLVRHADQFTRMSADCAASGDRLPQHLRHMLADRCAASTTFSTQSEILIRTAQSQSGSIRAVMGLFLSSLRGRETARADFRSGLAGSIDAAVSRTSGELYRSMLQVLAGGAACLMIMCLLTAWLRRRVIRPIELIADRLRHFSSTDMGDLAVPGMHRRDELGDLARGLSQYCLAVQKRRSAEQRADFLAHHDVLTGLPNRLLFDHRLAHELARSRRTGERLAVFAIDLDNFKAVNDRHGHAGGDRVLQQAAEILQGSVRPDDLVARLGGDEFAIIQVTPDQPRAAEALVSRLFAIMGDAMEGGSAIRMSVGVVISDPEQDMEELHNLADMAMYRAKSDGRNTARFFDTGLKDEVRLRWRLTADLEAAAARGELHVAFQPLAQARTLDITGYEALLRWVHPELGRIAPDMFIPLAESTGLIYELGLWVADQAMAVATHWHPGISLALNLSPIQFRKGDLGNDLLALCGVHGMSPSRLEIEVTESATLLGSHREEVLATLRHLKSRGARIVMDDFGTGHSSLGNLRDFPFDKLKIDRGFVLSLLTHAPSASIVRTIIALGESLRIPIVAEGVETEDQLAQLREWGCDQVQGFLIGRPEAVDSIVTAAACRPVPQRHARPGHDRLQA
ncbi:EAL domain-containing protein [uncultured Sphingomonas sp.]|uniref:putative bifunctional diguanylate cyclase/phosphodiesterase n=1 Tax=uncultured Sphingomonas sp. TaxID=158754 RepID=UPI0025E059BB|nr:EAL domain-containing protein [uncultured Sphingomonas sp.]